MLSSLGCPDAPALAAAAREVAASRRNFPGVDRGRSGLLVRFACVFYSLFVGALHVRVWWMTQC